MFDLLRVGAGYMRIAMIQKVEEKEGDAPLERCTGIGTSTDRETTLKFLCSFRAADSIVIIVTHRRFERAMLAWVYVYIFI